jgi:large subunit ribosomal protein L25
MAEALKTSLRSVRGKSAARSLRRAGQVPAVIYAHGEPTRELTVGERDFIATLDAIRGKSPLIDVQVGDEVAVKCIIKSVQRHPITLKLSHVDFQKVHAHEKVTINIPIHLTGTPVGIKMGGLLDHALRELPVRGLPEHLPANVTLDISELKLNQSLHVSDIKFVNVEVQLPLTTPIASVQTPKKVEEKVEVAAEAAAPAEGEEPKEPEVISEKKTEERAAERAKAEAETKGGKAAKAAPEEAKKPEKKK